MSSWDSFKWYKYVETRKEYCNSNITQTTSAQLPSYKYTYYWNDEYINSRTWLKQCPISVPILHDKSTIKIVFVNTTLHSYEQRQNKGRSYSLLCGDNDRLYLIAQCHDWTCPQSELENVNLNIYFHFIFL